MTILDADVLVTTAQHKTGLSDFGDDTVPARVALVVDRLNGARLDDAGVQAATDTITGLLISRLRFIADRARLPVAAERIIAPLFATGEPRSGTTLLHALLAEDEDSRALRFWEVMYPRRHPVRPTPTTRAGPGPTRTGVTFSSEFRRGLSATLQRSARRRAARV